MVNTALTALDPNRVRTFSVGFDRMFDRLFDESENIPTTQINYPPYNIIKTDDVNYVIQLAVAGFSKNDIEIETKENHLTVRSVEKDAELVDEVEYLHKGISNRSFKRSFTIADDVEVNGASYENGMLSISLTRIIPEEKQPRLIKIK
jgi:molecular chaperone IbpA